MTTRTFDCPGSTMEEYMETRDDTVPVHCGYSRRWTTADGSTGLICAVCWHTHPNSPKRWPDLVRVDAVIADEPTDPALIQVLSRGSILPKEQS